MSSFSHTGGGGVTMKGAASPIKLVQQHLTEFGVRDLVYVKAKAIKGKLEKICVKKINRVGPSSPTCVGAYYAINYVDTTNRVWMEDELIWLDEALPLATAYWERQLALATS